MSQHMEVNSTDLEAIANYMAAPKPKKAGAAYLYFRCLRAGVSSSSFAEVNGTIMAKWSRRGLKDIKQAAWHILDAYRYSPVLSERDLA